MNYIKRISENEFLISLFVKPKSKNQKIVNDIREDEFLVISLQSAPHKNKANIELIKLLKSKLRNQVDKIQIISGNKSQIKKIKLITIKPIEKDQIHRLITN